MCVFLFVSKLGSLNISCNTSNLDTILYPNKRAGKALAQASAPADKRATCRCQASTKK